MIRERTVMVTTTEFLVADQIANMPSFGIILCCIGSRIWVDPSLALGLARCSSERATNSIANVSAAPPKRPALLLTQDFVSFGDLVARYLGSHFTASTLDIDRKFAWGAGASMASLSAWVVASGMELAALLRTCRDRIRTGGALDRKRRLGARARSNEGR